MMNLSPRTGRPIKGETKKELRLQLRLNQEEMDRIDKCAIRLGITRTDVVNKGIRLVEAQLDEQK